MGILKLPENDKAREKTWYRQNHLRNEPAFQTRVMTIGANFQVMLAWATHALGVLRAWLAQWQAFAAHSAQTSMQGEHGNSVMAIYNLIEEAQQKSPFQIHRINIY